jgi:hypothetical protein
MRVFLTLPLLCIAANTWASALLSPRWPVIESFAQTQCAWQANTPQIRIFRDAAEWSSIFPGSPNTPFKQAPDWERDAVIALTLGPRETSGFSLELNENAFALEHGNLRLDFHERKPTADGFRQQVITQPCIFILTQHGTWQKVSLRNTETGAQLEAAMPPANVNKK